MKNRNEIFYSLNIDDIQMIATQETGRELTDDEIEPVKRLTAEKINWHEAILNSINETVNLNRD